jgi:rSAM/selenodomain-associated transferase 2
MRLAIVIPTLNEEANVRELLPQLAGVADEIQVSDGTSADGTVAAAERLGAAVVTGPPGRGGQLNRGARATSAELLLFLHADSRLPPGAPELLRRAVAEGAAGGGFHVRYDDGRPMFRLANRLIRQRTLATGCPLGDQAQFVTRTAFEALGGFREWPILEDLDFIRRLKRYGDVVLVDEPVTTSARRISRQGVAKSVATNWLIWTLYFLGAPPHRLARLYRHIR